MAKRKKLEEEEISLPPFDAEGYYRKEKEKTKLYIIFSLAALLLGVASAILEIEGLVFVSAFVGIGGIFAIIYFSDAILNLEELNFKDKLGPIFILFILYLGTWTLTINAPFGDVSPPYIEGVYYYQNDSWKKCEYYQGVYFINSTEDMIKVGFKIYDASEVKVRILIEGVERNVEKSQMEGIYYVEVSSAEISGTWVTAKVIAEDSHKNTSSMNYQITLKPSKVIF